MEDLRNESVELQEQLDKDFAELKTLTKRKTYLSRIQNPEDKDTEELEEAKLRIKDLRELCKETADDIAELKMLDQKYAGSEVQVVNLNPLQGSELLHANAAPAPAQQRAEAHSPTFHPNQYKIPPKLPQYVPFQTRLESFFDIAEMKLMAFGTHKSFWPKALINMTEDQTTLHWINHAILQHNLPWEQARAAFTKEMSKQGDSKHQMLDDLQKFKQANLSTQDFFRYIQKNSFVTVGFKGTNPFFTLVFSY